MLLMNKKYVIKYITFDKFSGIFLLQKREYKVESIMDAIDSLKESEDKYFILSIKLVP